MKQGFIALSVLFEAHEEFPKAVVPRMSGFNDPSTVLWGAAALAFLPAHPWGIAVCNDRLLGWLPVISSIRIEERANHALGRFHDERVEDGAELADIMSICSCHYQRQRDATSVHQQMALGAIFFPDLLDSALPLQFPSAI